MQIFDGARTSLATLLTDMASSSQKAGSFMNRLIRWVTPPLRIPRTSYMGSDGAPKTELGDRVVKAYNETPTNGLAANETVKIEEMTEPDWKISYQNAHKTVNAMKARDPYLFSQNNLSVALLQQSAKKNHLVVRTLFEQALKSQSDEDHQDKLFENMQTALNPEHLKNRFSTDAIKSAYNDIAYAYDHVVNNNTYPEHKDYKHTIPATVIRW